GRAWILLLRPNAVKTPSGSAGSAPRARDQPEHDEDGVHLPHAAARAAVAVGLRRIGDEAAAVLLAGERRAEGLAAIPSQRRLLALAGRVEAGAFGVVGDRLALRLLVEVDRERLAEEGRLHAAAARAVELPGGVAGA